MWRHWLVPMLWDLTQTLISQPCLGVVTVPKVRSPRPFDYSLLESSTNPLNSSSQMSLQFFVVHYRKYFSSFGRVPDSRNSKLHSLWFQNSAGFLCTKFHENATGILWEIILTERQIAGIFWGIFSELIITIARVSYICRWIYSYDSGSRCPLFGRDPNRC